MKAMTTKKTVISYTVAAVLGLGSKAAITDPVVGFKIQDVGSNTMGSGGYSSTTDGISGAFSFASMYLNVANYSGASFFTGDAGTGTILGEGAANSTGSFSTGFIFSSAPFVPFTFGSGLNAEMGAGDDNLAFTSLDFGGNFGGGANFLLPPDANFPLQVLWSRQTAPNSVEWDVAMRWGHIITTAEDITGNFTGFQAQWVLEGTMTVTDSKPVITVTPGPSVIPAGVPYVDPGATCVDVVDGPLAVTTTTDPVTDLNNPQADFDMVYNCQDTTASLDADEQRRALTVSSGPDTTPPVITLNACTTAPGINCSEDGSANTNTVDVLLGTPYTDAGGNCIDDFDGPIAFSAAGPDPVFTSTPYPPAADTSTATGNTPIQIDFSCRDTAGNAATVVTRTINVLVDDVPPKINLNGEPTTLTRSLNDPSPDLLLGITCTDKNPVDNPGGTGKAMDITANLDFDPTSIDTSVTGSTTVTYTCLDNAGNPATPLERTVNVVSGQQFEILSMTISDVITNDGLPGHDGLAGCFRFKGIDPATCDGANQFSSDGSAADTPGPGEIPGAGQTLPGIGSDKVTLEDANGNPDDPLIGTPIGVRFGVFQDTIGQIAPGFNFAGYPFQPVTFDPPTATATPPAGSVIVAGDTRFFDFDSFPFSGVYSSGQPNTFYLPPDPGTLSTLNVNPLPVDAGSPTRTFQYRIGWSHFITEAEDPTRQYSGLNANWLLEGIVTTSSTATVQNTPPIIKTLSAGQNSFAITQIIVKNDGNVTATVVADDTETTPGNLSYQWSGPVVPIGGSTGTTFTFDPSGLPSGNLTLTVKVTDDNPDSPLSTSEDLVLNIVTTPPNPNYGDDDDDRIPNYLDNTSVPTRNSLVPSDPTTEMVVSAGRLRLGDYANSTGSGSFHIPEDLLIELDPVNGEDPLDRVKGIGHSGAIDNFEIADLNVGESVQIVIPQTAPIANTPVERKYKTDTGWIDFQATQGNAVASAKSAGGICPGPSSPLYDDTVGLVEGDDCVRLTIVDGSSMDTDGQRNGKVNDPSAAAGNGAVKDGHGVSSFGSSSGGGCSVKTTPVSLLRRGDWWIMAIFVAGLGWVRRKFGNSRR